MDQFLLDRHIGPLPFAVACIDRHTAVLYAISYLLLFFAGRGVEAPPSFDLCLIQAAMTYAVCPLSVLVFFQSRLEVVILHTIGALAPLSCCLLRCVFMTARDPAPHTKCSKMWIGVCKPTKGRCSTTLKLAVSDTQSSGALPAEEVPRACYCRGFCGWPYSWSLFGYVNVLRIHAIDQTGTCVQFGLADRGGVHLTRSLYCMIRNRVPLSTISLFVRTEGLMAHAALVCLKSWSA
jgi:hypothetical protein